MIRLKNTHKCHVTSDFWRHMDTYIDKAILDIVEDIQSQPNQLHAQDKAKRYSKVFANLHKVKNRDDRMVLALSRLQYESLSATEKKIIARANNIDCKSTDNDNTLNLGDFDVCISWKAFDNANKSFIDFLPDPYVDYRHPHHYQDTVDEPLTSTCWGDYSPWVRDGLLYFNIPHLLSGLYQFLTNYDPDDTLVLPDLIIKARLEAHGTSNI